MNQYLRILVFGFLTWLVPFIASFFFFKQGQLTVPDTFFKTIMIIVSSFVGSGLIIMYFSGLKAGFLREGIVLGVTWLLINWVLDLLLVNRGFFPYTYVQYFQDIGLRYLSIPIWTITVGIIAHNLSRQYPTQLPVASPTDS